MTTNKSMKDMSPDEIRQMMHDRVAKGVAGTTGALEGWVQNSEPQAVGEAAGKAKETVTKTTQAIREELRQTRSELGGGGPGMGEKLRERAGEVGERVSEMGHQVGERVGEVGHKVGERAQRLGERVTERAREAGNRARERVTQTREDAARFMREHTPEEIRQRAREVVGRQVAGTTGALEGYAEQAEPQLPAKAIHKAGETVRAVGHAVKGGSQGGGQQGQTSTKSTSAPQPLAPPTEPIDPVTGLPRRREGDLGGGGF